MNVASFRAFCALADVDPDDGRRWNKRTGSSSLAVRDLHPDPESHRHKYIWLSRSKDIVFESSTNPLNDGYCHYFGLTGVADKAIALYFFVCDHYVHFDDQSEDKIGVHWADLGYGRDYI